MPIHKNKQYTIANNRVVTRSLEVNLVDHCNIRCWGCCALSPMLEEESIAPSVLQRDLAVAKTCLEPTYLKLVGGEPLLHPNIVECLTVAKASDVGTILSMTSNGLLLGNAPDELWQLLDAITISFYPQVALKEPAMTNIRTKAERFSVTLNLKYQDNFVDMTRSEAMLDERINQAIYDDCWLRRRCHRLESGVLYTCTRPPAYRKLFPEQKTEYLADGIKLENRDGMAEDILAYLISDQPLNTCRNCRGGSAELKPHRLLSTKEVKQELISWRL